ncbi:Exosome complex exonuclease rrp41 [Heterostelium album PN500]|uniref:Exosome complex exonuclease rrp41 n=1 Tax=Heterostelium pallidum (strain ATCC 26659 / Pp 5 / PN500) TaxID=670386 RepID=D3BKA2_HETP5|nr:Exosome complex exonuclease rrp41 [Heterostelium album PN500]EFA78332.1 Exosome complex exonuclease rrp41 [Heterostelium album PN500]|eukprot:XP_020430457.1 Exosome complex exonuclease rrp41 [Heterostelium album PN500]
MSKLSYITPEGLRIDGRRNNEIRRLNMKMGIFNRADGSAYYEQGNTKITVAVYGPREVASNQRMLHDRAIVNCEYSQAAFSSATDRKPTRKSDKQSYEIASLIKQAFESTIQITLFPRSQIDIYVQVLQADGGLKAAALNAATLAVIDAGLPMRDFICACSATFIEGVPLLDMNQMEERSGGADLLLSIQPQLGGVISLNMESKVPQDMFESVLELANLGCMKIFALLQTEVKRHSADLLSNQINPKS